MLVRRFSIVCLMVALFGMGMSVLVADASRSQRHAAGQSAVSCLFEGGPACARSAI